MRELQRELQLPIRSPLKMRKCNSLIICYTASCKLFQVAEGAERGDDGAHSSRRQCSGYSLRRAQQVHAVRCSKHWILVTDANGQDHDELLPGEPLHRGPDDHALVPGPEPRQGDERVQRVRAPSCLLQDRGVLHRWQWGCLSSVYTDNVVQCCAWCPA